MVFSSLIFICLFLPVFLGLYYLHPNAVYRNVVLVLFSLLFYAWGEPVYVVLLIISAAVDYTVGRVIEAKRGTGWAKAALGVSLGINLGILCVFKYAGFFIENVNLLFGTAIPFRGFALPLGISFYTFQTLSYSIDVYRGNAKVQRSFLKFLAYVSMFPQLVAGPIVRYVDIEEQIDNRRFSVQEFRCGILRFTQGMCKKVLLANSAGAIASGFLDGNLAGQSAAGVWFGMLMYAFQIYYDFSGYSDIAIGLGRMLGFTFPENFNYPYISRSITEFWRRWHISLSTFFRDYVYIPLGGNRRHQVLNILIVWFTTGLWHGASWNFVLWGLYYGILLLIEKKLFGGALMRLPAAVGVIYNSAAVLLGWVLFYFTDMHRLVQFLRTAFGGSGVWVDKLFLGEFTGNIFLVALLFLCATPLLRNLWRTACSRLPRISAAAEPVLAAGGMILTFSLLVGQTYNPFLYFRF